MKPTPIILATAALAIGAWTLLNPTTQAAQKLLPFQGRLTDASGTPVADGAKVVQFKIYDAPTGGTAVWNGEVQKVTVNGGLVSTLLGSKADLSNVDFNGALYLEITVDANADNQITPADPPLLPRQSILPAVFAVEAQQARDSSKLAGADWTAILAGGSNDPITGTIRGDKIASGSIGTSQFANGSITAAQLYSETARSLVPAGTILPFGGIVAPPGYLMCDGAVVSRTTYAGLFGVIAAAYGAPDGGTFNVPDFRGRFLRGTDDPDGAAPTYSSANTDPDKASRTPMKAGGNTGNNVGSIQVDATAKNGLVLGDIGHTHTIPTQTFLNNSGIPAGGATNTIINTNQGGAVANALTSSSNPSGVTLSSNNNETRPLNAYVNYIIKY